MKVEADMDIHLVIADPRFPARTMIVAFPLTRLSCAPRRYGGVR
jgi:hypothetical protein